jgi:hypothetical protein
MAGPSPAMTIEEIVYLGLSTRASWRPAGQDRIRHMTNDPVKAVLERVSTWPEDRQQELAELALEIEAELAGASYEATPNELTAIDEGLAGEAASEEEIKRGV